MFDSPQIQAAAETLAIGEVHVWQAPLNLVPARLKVLHQTLAPEEQARAEGFHFLKHRDRFSAARGILRKLLGCYLHRAPEEISFSYGLNGKPQLAEPAEALLQFNLSHSHGQLLLAFCHEKALGIDLEFIDEKLEIAAVAERYFSAEENAELAALPKGSQREGFFNAWTRKEAYLKGRGEGFSKALHQFAVSLAPGSSPVLRVDRLNPEAVAQWSLYALAAEPGYIASLAVHGLGMKIRQFALREAPDG